jgi:hypothetical protein
LWRAAGYQDGAASDVRFAGVLVAGGLSGEAETPEEFVVSAVRASDADGSNAVPLTQALTKLGMPFYGMQTPNGYSWMATAWLNTVYLENRMNFALSLSGDRVAGVQTDWTGLLSDPVMGEEPAVLAVNQSDSEEVLKEKKLEALLMGQPVSEQTRTTVLQQFHLQTTQQQAAKNFSIRANDSEPMAAVLNPATQQRRRNRRRTLRGLPWLGCCWDLRSFSGGRVCARKLFGWQLPRQECVCKSRRRRSRLGSGCGDMYDEDEEFGGPERLGMRYRRS